MPRREWEDVVMGNKPVEAYAQLSRYDFFDWLKVLNVLEMAHGPLVPAYSPRIRSLLRAYVDPQSTNSNPDALLFKIVCELDEWQPAWVVEFLIVECGAKVRANDSFRFLGALFYHTTPEAVRAVCDRYWDRLLKGGLDVDGVCNRGRQNLLSDNMTDPDVVQRALAHGANPFIVNTRDELDLLEHMRDRMERIYHSSQRENIQQSMRLVEAARSQLALNGARRFEPIHV